MFIPIKTAIKVQKIAKRPSSFKKYISDIHQSRFQFEIRDNRIPDLPVLLDLRSCMKNRFQLSSSTLAFSWAWLRPFSADFWPPAKKERHNHIFFAATSKIEAEGASIDRKRVLFFLLSWKGHLNDCAENGGAYEQQFRASIEQA